MQSPLKLGQAAKVLGVHRDTMRKMCREGIVEAWQIPAGSRFDWRINPESLEACKGDLKVLELARKAGI